MSAQLLEAFEGYRLSPQQERLWVLHGNSSIYRTQCAVAVEGRLNVAPLGAALQRLVDRHEILRTSYRSPRGVDIVLQVIAPSATIRLDELDLSALARPEQDAELERCYQREQTQPFDLSAEPMLRATLARLAPDRHVLILSAPAIAVDVPSMMRLVEELVQGYAGGSSQPAGDEELVQYADFAQWQHELLETEAGREGKAYWARAEHQHPRPLRLPFEKEPKDEARELREWFVTGEVVAGLDRIAEQRQVPASQVLLACWHVLLWRMTGRPDRILVDTYLDVRKYDHLAGAVGCYGHYLPVGCSLEDAATLDAALQHVGVGIQHASRWQEFFPRAMRARENDGSAMHRIGFAYDALPETLQAGASTRFRVDRLHRCSERLKLELVCARRGETLRLAVYHDPSVYTGEAIEQLKDALQTLLEGAARNPDALVGHLPVLNREARAAMLTRWNPTPKAAPSCLVHELFEAQAARTPGALAVVFEDTELTYAQLNARANQLARHLRTLGVGPSVPVGLFVERSAEMIVGLLGILKAGGAYLPIEPTLPTRRCTLLLEQARVRVLVTEQQLASAIEAPVTIVRLDGDRETLARLSAENLDPMADERDLAYVIFTSGSTGTPKGVAVEHRQVVRYTLGAIERLELQDVASFATVSTLAADLGNTSIFPALFTGGALHVISQERASDASALAEHFTRRPCDFLKIVPSHMAALVQASPQPARIMPRKRLVCGGEMLSWGEARVFETHAPQCRIFNHYGPTETTVGAIAGAARRQDAATLSEAVPLGHPLAHARIYVLEPSGEPAPVGVPGEIFIGGDTIARGYINRPDLTAERFVPDSLSGVPGARLYRTGDRGRYLPDGSIEFLGRIDRQVKLRGFRIELAEVEIVLRQHDTLREAIVVMNGVSGYQRLDAYVVGQQDQAASVDELRAHLKARLPDYMVPTNIVLLDKIPRTPNGKINYDALPAPEHIIASDKDSYVAPRTATETTVVGIFADMLGLERVGVHDDFFEIGGHSLLATRLLSRLREAFQIELSLRSVFEATNAADLAAIIDSQVAESVQAAQSAP